MIRLQIGRWIFHHYKYFSGFVRGLKYWTAYSHWIYSKLMEISSKLPIQILCFPNLSSTRKSSYILHTSRGLHHFLFWVLYLYWSFYIFVCVCENLRSLRKYLFPNNLYFKTSTWKIYHLSLNDYWLIQKEENQTIKTNKKSFHLLV